MNHNAVSSVRPALEAIVIDVFQHSGSLSPDMGPNQIPRWDSLQHIALVRSIEEAFDISLTMDEMMEMRTIADIETVLRRHGM